MLCDLHIHTNMSDGTCKLDQIEMLSKKKYTKAGIADHVSPFQKINTNELFDDYIKKLSEFEIYKGCEICLGADINIDKDKFRELDYMIGSMHFLNIEKELNLFFWDQSVRFPDIDFFINRYVEQMIFFLNNIKMDIFGHPTIMPIFLSQKDQDELFSEEQIFNIVKAGVKNNVAFELSSRWFLPKEKFLMECKRQNALISLGSDAHKLDQAFNLDYGLIMINKLGLSRDLIFTPR